MNCLPNRNKRHFIDQISNYRITNTSTNIISTQINNNPLTLSYYNKCLHNIQDCAISVNTREMINTC